MVAYNLAGRPTANSPPTPTRLGPRTPARSHIARNQSPIPVSSEDSSPASAVHIAIPAKRASPQTAQDPPAKRPKPLASPEKENVYQPSAYKGKAREHPLPRIDFSQATSGARTTSSRPIAPVPQSPTLPSTPRTADSRVAASNALRLFQTDNTYMLSVRHCLLYT